MNHLRRRMNRYEYKCVKYGLNNYALNMCTEELRLAWVNASKQLKTERTDRTERHGSTERKGYLIGLLKKLRKKKP